MNCDRPASEEGPPTTRCVPFTFALRGNATFESSRSTHEDDPFATATYPPSRKATKPPGSAASTLIGAFAAKDESSTGLPGVAIEYSSREESLAVSSRAARATPCWKFG